MPLPTLQTWTLPTSTFSRGANAQDPLEANSEAACRLWYQIVRARRRMSPPASMISWTTLRRYSHLFTQLVTTLLFPTALAPSTSTAIFWRLNSLWMLPPTNFMGFPSMTRSQQSPCGEQIETTPAWTAFFVVVLDSPKSLVAAGVHGVGSACAFHGRSNDCQGLLREGFHGFRCVIKSLAGPLWAERNLANWNPGLRRYVHGQIPLVSLEDGQMLLYCFTSLRM